MNHERTNELLSAAADDDLSSAEQAELENLLTQSPEAGRAQAELSQLQSILADIPALDPPDDLHEKIVGRVTLPGAGRSIDNWSIVDWMKQIELGSVLRYGFSGAIGVMLAVAVYESQPNFALSTDITEIVGTMAPDSERAVLDSFVVTAIGVSSVVRLEQRDDALLLDIRLEAATPIDIRIDFTGAELDFEALAQTFNNLDSIEFSEQVLKVTGQGQRRFAVLMRSRDDESFTKEKKINLEYSRNGVLVQKGTLSSVR